MFKNVEDLMNIVQGTLISRSCKLCKRCFLAQDESFSSMNKAWSFLCFYRLFLHFYLFKNVIDKRDLISEFPLPENLFLCHWKGSNPICLNWERTPYGNSASSKPKLSRK